MKQLVFATNNIHKLTELRQLVGSDFEILSLADIDCFDDIPETGKTIEDNAILKAKWVNEHYGLDCFSDDTGLEVTALDGAPGVHTARYGGVAHDSERNIDRLLRELDGAADRSACFRTIIALIMDGDLSLFAGCVKGQILTERRGTGGFGYDSVFCPDEGDGRSFAQMSPEEKNAISHRGRAVAQLVDWLRHPMEKRRVKIWPIQK